MEREPIVVDAQLRMTDALGMMSQEYGQEISRILNGAYDSTSKRFSI